jgi:hypothetical protein
MFIAIPAEDVMKLRALIHVKGIGRVARRFGLDSRTIQRAARGDALHGVTARWLRYRLASEGGDQ